MDFVPLHEHDSERLYLATWEESIEEDQEQDEFRGSPNSFLVEWFTEAGRSAAQMLALEKLEIQSTCDPRGLIWLERYYSPFSSLQYTAARKRASAAPLRHLVLKAEPVLELGGGLTRAWEAVARLDPYGGEIRIDSLPNEKRVPFSGRWYKCGYFPTKIPNLRVLQ